jgi:ribonuclease P protein component
MVFETHRAGYNAAIMDERLRPTERLQTAGDFRRVFQRGRAYSTQVLRIHYIRGARDLSRMGLVVSRRRGKSNVRSLLKRRLREVFRREKKNLPGSFDLVLIPRGKAREYHAFREAMEGFVRHLQGSRRRGRRGKTPPQTASGASAEKETSCR